MSSVYRSAAALPLVLQAATAADGLPSEPVLDWLARLRLLEGVPFAYLVPDERLLPLESIRFGFLDRNWVDAAVDGALAAGAGTIRERTHLKARYAQVRAAVDAAERRVFAAKAHPDLMWADAAAEVVTGFLLRSRAVSGWPGLHVRARRGGREVRPLRIERLAPSVLLALFDGLPDEVVVEEPRQGMQLGFDPGAAIPYRAGSPGVVDVTALAGQLGAASSSALALRLVQLPYRQSFTGAPGAPSFVPSLTLDDLAAAWETP